MSFCKKLKLVFRTSYSYATPRQFLVLVKKITFMIRASLGRRREATINIILYYYYY
jgi:hypothetical protein